ncbi:hypothetical protein GGU10DRAFT_384912 [Lentinula aff. detonsa]|uniref:Uncharacterized protein n=1 Tax=Lentinula aff. detonsa TaxID=2804958 RepID=A0AA38KHX4_9AGAR|nr:hypothetical protein GGU10DRAFT_384912 [Lentinula aff. detonsa]
MASSTNAPKEEDSSLLSPTEEPKAGSHDSSLDSTTENPTFDQQKAITEPDIEPRLAADSIEVANKDKETEETETKETKDWDVEPVRPEQQPRGRIKPPVSGSPSPRPKPK